MILICDYSTTGKPASIVAPNGETLGYTYDGFLPLSETWSGAVAGSVARTYDSDFRVTSLNVNGVNSIPLAYDADGLLTGAGSLAISRSAQTGFVTGATLGGTSTAYTYNTFGELASERHTGTGTTFYDVQYTRDKLGRITQRIETVGGVASTYGYVYDTAGRLVQVTKNSVVQSAYAYDQNGNRIGKTDATATTAGTYDAQDRLLTYGANAYSYTANGELLTKTNPQGTTSYTYDVLGNLTTVTLPDGTLIEYVIDGSNRRVGKKVNGVLVRGWLYANQLSPIAELDGAGNIVSTFIYGTKSNVPDYMIKGGTTYRIISNHLGSPLLVVDSTTGTVAQQITYDEFGVVATDTNPGFTPFGFSGGMYDNDTGLVRFGARDYDAESGRWTAKDPIRFEGGDTNLYGYVLNDPVNYVDLLGLFNANISDTGGKNGSTYGGQMTITGQNGQTTTVPVSTWPNPDNPNPGVATGEYPAAYNPQGHKGSQPGIRINDGKPVPALGPNPNNGGSSSATGINIHCGYSANNRGSAGCVTIHPNYCQSVWNVLFPGESGKVNISR